MAHNYHRQCGCYSCCKIEQQDECADELALELFKSGTILGEAMGALTDEQLALMAGHLANGNDDGVAEILRSVVSYHIEEMIDARMDAANYSRIEAVNSLIAAHEVKRASVSASLRAAA